MAKGNKKAFAVSSGTQKLLKRDARFEKMRKMIAEQVKKHGWILFPVFSDGGTFSFAFTIGLYPSCARWPACRRA
jgi:hypothetical protein